MAITYPLVLPSVGLFIRFSLNAESIAGESTSPFTFEQQIQVHQGMRWTSRVSIAPLKRINAVQWITFLRKLNGLQGTFLMGDLGAKLPQGIATGTPQVNGASQIGQTLLTKGWTTGVTGILLAGDYIQIGTGATSRLYQNLNDVNSDGGGLATLDIWPQIRSPSPADSAVIIVNNPVGLFRLSENITNTEIDSIGFYGLGFNAVEVVA